MRKGGGRVAALPRTARRMERRTGTGQDVRRTGGTDRRRRNRLSGRFLRHFGRKEPAPLLRPARIRPATAARLLQDRRRKHLRHQPPHQAAGRRPGVSLPALRTGTDAPASPMRTGQGQAATERGEREKGSTQEESRTHPRRGSLDDTRKPVPESRVQTPGTVVEREDRRPAGSSRRA